MSVAAAYMFTTNSLGRTVGDAAYRFPNIMEYVFAILLVALLVLSNCG